MDSVAMAKVNLDTKRAKALNDDKISLEIEGAISLSFDPETGRWNEIGPAQATVNIHS